MGFADLMLSACSHWIALSHWDWCIWDAKLAVLSCVLCCESGLSWMSWLVGWIPGLVGVFM